MSFFEKLRASPLSLSRMRIAPSPCLMAVSMLFRKRSPSPSLTSILSITTSMLWFLYRSVFMPFVISNTSPSTLTYR